MLSLALERNGRRIVTEKTRSITSYCLPMQIAHLHKKAVTCGLIARHRLTGNRTGDHGTISPTAPLILPAAAVDFAIFDSSANYLELLSVPAYLAGVFSRS